MIRSATNHWPGYVVTHMESAFLSTVKLLPMGLAVSLIGLGIQQSPSPLTTVTIHLMILVGFGLWSVARMAPSVDDPWLTGTSLSPRWRAFWSGAMVVSFATGLVALLTLASSAALRYDPSLQFLQLLSALDITWAGAALFLGVRWLKGTRLAWLAAVVLGLFCTWSIWNYLHIVGFSSQGGWQVDRSALMRHVLPYDMAAAVVAISALWAGSRYFTAQRKPQS